MVFFLIRQILTFVMLYYYINKCFIVLIWNVCSFVSSNDMSKANLYLNQTTYLSRHPWPEVASKMVNLSEKDNWFISVPLVAVWNEMTSTVLRCSWVQRDKKKNKWSVGHRKINTTWQGCGNCSVAFCSHVTSINQHVFHAKLWIISKSRWAMSFLFLAP